MAERQEPKERKWVTIRVLWNDGTEDVWTPESLAKIRHIAADLIDSVLRQAEKHE
jgi:hypothetical protein